jgi:hypothetical protein
MRIDTKAVGDLRMDSEQVLVCLTGHPTEPSHLVLKPGQTCLHGPTASFFREAQSDECLQACLPQVTSLRLAHDAQVIEYKLQFWGHRTMLSVKFVEGGHCRVTFDPSGELDQLEGTKVSITRAGGELTIGPLGLTSGNPSRIS